MLYINVKFLLVSLSGIVQGLCCVKNNHCLEHFVMGDDFSMLFQECLCMQRIACRLHVDSA